MHSHASATAATTRILSRSSRWVTLAAACVVAYYWWATLVLVFCRTFVNRDVHCWSNSLDRVVDWVMWPLSPPLTFTAPALLSFAAFVATRGSLLERLKSTAGWLLVLSILYGVLAVRAVIPVLFWFYISHTDFCECELAAWAGAR